MVRIAATITGAGPSLEACLEPGADHFWWDAEEKVADLVASFFAESFLGNGDKGK